jgi:undecaprenyl-diphosphatase
VSVSESVDRFDARVEARVVRIRGHGWLDRIFYTASFLADHGILWFAFAAIRYLSGVGGADAAHFAGIRAACGELGQSGLVNGPLKYMFRRARPVHEVPRPYRLRVPRTTSFPSGHSSASFCAAVLLSQGTSWAWWLFPLAMIVSFSRVYVRIHHMSDVIGGAIVGAALGVAIAHFAPLP